MRPSRASLPADDVRRFRDRLSIFLNATDGQGRKWADATWGVYAFYDYDGEPIYVGQTNERLRTRIRRHLTNQRTDAVAMRILDVFEVAEVEVFPLWDLQGVSRKDADARRRLDSLEYSVYLHAIAESRFKAILNEKIPPVSPVLQALPPAHRAGLIDEATRAERGHPDIRIERRAETVSRLSSVARERGEVSDGLRRVLGDPGRPPGAPRRGAARRGRRTPGARPVHSLQRRLPGRIRALREQPRTGDP